jgi:hypothetical protein
MIYLKQHAQALRWDYKPDFRTPKEKEKEQSKDDSKESSTFRERHPNKRKNKHESKSDRRSYKTKRIHMTDKRSPNPKRAKNSDQCRRQKCRERSTHTNHTHSECKFKESDTPKHSNLGKAPAKKQRNSKTNSSQPAKNAQAPKALNANGAISATSQIILQMRVRAKGKSKPALKHRFTKTKASWRYGKAHSPIAINRNAPPRSSKPGAMTFAPLA